MKLNSTLIFNFHLINVCLHSCPRAIPFHAPSIGRSASRDKLQSMSVSSSSRLGKRTEKRRTGKKLTIRSCSLCMCSHMFETLSSSLRVCQNTRKETRSIRFRFVYKDVHSVAVQHHSRGTRTVPSLRFRVSQLKKYRNIYSIYL